MTSSNAQTRYAEAKRAYSLGSYREALTSLDALAAEFPNAKNIALARAKCLMKLGDFDSAADACTAVLKQHDDARAARLLEKCRVKAAAPAPESLDGDLDVGERLPDAFKPPPVPRDVHRYVYTLTALVVVGIALAGGARIIADAIATPPEGTEGFSDAEVHRAERNRPRTEDPAPVTSERSAPENDESGLVREIPDTEWIKTAINGVPDWRPGIFRNVRCGNHVFDIDGQEWPRTIDVYIPRLYGERTEELFPTLTISMPGINPGFIGLEQWAETRGVILVALNSSRNGPAANNLQAQDAAYEILAPSLRAHPTLNFATGMSGGAQASWLAVRRRPEIFSGLLMMGQAGYDDLPLSAHVRVGFIRGQQEPNTARMRAMMNRLRAAGHDVRETVVPGAHVMGPIDVRMKMLDWLLDSGRQEFSIPDQQP